MTENHLKNVENWQPGIRFYRQREGKRKCVSSCFRIRAALLTCELLPVFFIAGWLAGMDEQKPQWGRERRRIQNLKAREPRSMLHPEGCFQPLCDINYRSTIILKWFATLALIVTLLSKLSLQTPYVFLFTSVFGLHHRMWEIAAKASLASSCLLASFACLEDASATSNKKSDSDLKTKDVLK